MERIRAKGKLIKTYRKLELPLAALTVLIKKPGDSQGSSLIKPKANHMRSEESKLAS